MLELPFKFLLSALDVSVMTEQKIDLAKEHCEQSSSDIPPMAVAEALKLLQNLHEGWSINALGRIERAFLTKDFLQSLSLAVLVGKVAEQSRYYPELMVSYGLLRVEIWTRAINGLSRSDFVLAAKIDEALVLEGRAHV